MSPSAAAWNVATGLGMAAVGLVALAWGRRRLGPGQGAWAGASAWSLSVTLKLAAAAATYGALDRSLAARAAPPLALALEATYNGLLTGIFEVGLLAWIAGRGSLCQADFPRALRFGLAFGAAEAVSTGLAVVGLAAAASLAPGALPPRALALAAGLLRASGPTDLLWPAVERGSALVFHLVAVLLVVGGRRAGWPGLGIAAAFLGKGGVDAAAAAVLAAEGMRLSPGTQAVFECALAAVALAGLRAVGPLRRVLEGPAGGAGPPAARAA